MFSLEPYEDPVTGLERIASLNNLQSRRRRVRLPINSDVNQRSTSTASDQALSGKYESLDYEIGESELYRAEESSKGFQVFLFLKKPILLFILFRIICTGSQSIDG